MEYQKLYELANLLARSFSGEILRMISIYPDISSSEAASRLDIHIQTAQDFLEGMVGTGLAEKVEVMEGKRPYFRYRLKKRRIDISYNLDDLVGKQDEKEWFSRGIREKRNSGAIFKVGNRQDEIASVTIFEGEGRRRRERKINITRNQGRFLFHLPFPNAKPETIMAIMEKSSIQASHTQEVIDLLSYLIEKDIIE